MRSLLFALLALAILAGLWLVLKPPPAPPTAANEVRDSRIFELDLAASNHGPDSDGVLRARLGEAVVIQIRADRADDLHLHGYDLSLEVQPGRVAVMTLAADRAGRFELESHATHAVIAVLEVMP